MLRLQPGSSRIPSFLKRFCFGSVSSFVLVGLCGGFHAFAQTSYSPVDFGSVAVRGTSSQALSFSFTGLSQAPTFILHYSVDFTAGTPVCTSNGSSCTVSVTFSPRYPEVRQDAMVVKDSTGTVIATQFLHGVGLGPLLTVAPGTTSTLRLSGPFVSSIGGLVVDTVGNYYFSDTFNSVVYQVNPNTGVETVVAGAGIRQSGYTGDGGPAISATLRSPAGLAFDNAGNLYIADGGNHVVRRVDANTAIITTVVGNGQSGFSGDGGAATAATLNQPVALVTDAMGNLFITDRSGNVVRRVDAQTGIISTVAGTGVAGYSGDNGPSISAKLNAPQSAVLDAAGNLYIADTSNNVVREVSASTGIIKTIAGTGTYGYGGDGGDPLSAKFSSIVGVGADPAGNVLIADANNNAVREVNAAHTLITTTFTNSGSIAGNVAIDPSGSIYSGSYGAAIAKTILGTGTLPSFSTPVGSAAAAPVYLSNSGTLALNISAITITGRNPTEFSQTNTCGSSLAPGATCSVSVTFSPVLVSSYGESRTATLNVIHDGPFSPAAIFLSGTGSSALSVSSPSVFFPSTTVGSSSSSAVTVRNLGSNALAINSIAFINSTASLVFSQTNNCGSSLAPNAACQVNLVFTPTAIASYSGALNISYGSSSTPQTVSVYGSGTSSSISVPTSLFFSSQAVLTRSFPYNVYVSNYTSSARTLSNPVITGPAAKDFSFTSTCGSSLAANSSCYIYVDFSPFLIGSRSATLTINDNAGPHAVALSGTGTLPAQFEIVNSVTGKVLDVANSMDGTSVSQSALNGSLTQAWRAVSVPGGFYEIANVATLKALDLTGASSANGALIQQYVYLGYPNQQWQLVPADDAHYTIVSRQTGKVLDLPSASRGDGTPIQQWESNGSAQQRWTLVPTISYNITNRLSSKALSIANNSTADNAVIQQSTFLGVWAQQWQFVPVGAGYYAIVNRSTGKVLDVTGASSANGAPIQQYDYYGYPNQQWQTVPLDSSGTYKIVSRATGKVLDNTGYSTADGTPIQQWDDLGNSNQQWQISTINYTKIIGVQSSKALEAGGVLPAHLRVQFDAEQQKWQIITLPNGFMLIGNELSGQFLEVAGSSMLNGATIQQAPYTGNDNQQWSLVELYNGSYSIVNKVSGKVLDVTGRSTAEGAPIQQFQFLNGNNQQWYFSSAGSY